MPSSTVESPCASSFFLPGGKRHADSCRKNGCLESIAGVVPIVLERHAAALAEPQEAGLRRPGQPAGIEIGGERLQSKVRGEVLRHWTVVLSRVKRRSGLIVPSVGAPGQNLRCESMRNSGADGVR